MVSRQFTPAQAAAVTGLSIGAVHKAIDKRLVRPRLAKAGRSVRWFLSKEQLVYLQLEAGGLRLLPLPTRRAVAAMIERTPAVGRLLVGGGQTLSVEVKPARKKVAAELRRLAQAAAMAVRDPEIMGGAPVFRGTRIPVQLVADMLAQGATPEEILAGYPSLSLEKIALAPVYVRAFPRRGRPARRPWADQTPSRATTHRLDHGGRRVA